MQHEIKTNRMETAVAGWKTEIVPNSLYILPGCWKRYKL